MEKINNQNGNFNDSPHQDISYKWKDPYEQMRELDDEEKEYIKLEKEINEKEQ